MAWHYSGLFAREKIVTIRGIFIRSRPYPVFYPVVPAANSE
jgi:hypothetical protein